MGVLLGVLWPIEQLNSRLLAAARFAAVAIFAVMVLVVFYQIVMRMISPAGWTIAAAKFLMLWMIGLAAPIAYRQGGFVGIDLLERSIPRLAAHLLVLVILLMSTAVIGMCILLGWDMVDSFSGRGTIPGFKIELSWAGLQDFKVRNWHAFASLFTCFCLLGLVNIELLLRHIVRMAGGADRLTPLSEAEVMD